MELSFVTVEKYRLQHIISMMDGEIRRLSLNAQIRIEVNNNVAHYEAG